MLAGGAGAVASWPGGGRAECRGAGRDGQRRGEARERARGDLALFEIGSVTKVFTALLLADAALRSVQAIGMPEARIILGQVVVYLATSAKSNSTYKAINAAMALAEKDASPVPLHLRNGVTKLMRTQGYGQNYHYPHDYPNHYYPQSYLPDTLSGTKFYEFADNQREQHSKQFMDWLKNQAASND